MVTELIDRVLVRTGTVGIGETRIPSGHPIWQRESRITGWPTIAFARVPVRIRQSGREPVVADPNTAIFFNPDQPYTRAPIDSRGDHCDWIEIRPEALTDILSKFDPRAADRTGAPFTFDHGSSTPRVYLRQRLNSLRARQPGADPIELEENTLEVAADVIAAAYSTRALKGRTTRQTTSLAHRAIVEDVKSLLGTRLTDGLSLATISHAVHISPFHLCRVFRQHTGLPIHRYLDRLRLRAALEPVAEKSVGLADLADTLGYSSHSHFTAAFRREFGITPSELRRTASMPLIREHHELTLRAG